MPQNTFTGYRLLKKNGTKIAHFYQEKNYISFFIIFFSFLRTTLLTFSILDLE